MENTVSLSVPAKKPMLLIIRMTTAGVLARAGLTLDTLDDVKMAVEEACEYLMARTACKSLALSYMADAKQITVKVAGEGCTCCGNEKCEEQVLRCILESLVDDVALHFDEQSRLQEVQLVKQMRHADT